MKKYFPLIFSLLVWLTNYILIQASAQLSDISSQPSSTPIILTNTDSNFNIETTQGNIQIKTTFPLITKPLLRENNKDIILAFSTILDRPATLTMELISDIPLSNDGCSYIEEPRSQQNVIPNLPTKIYIRHL